MAHAKSDLQQLSRMRLDDAKLLLGHERYSSSYYLWLRDRIGFEGRDCKSVQQGNDT